MTFTTDPPVVGDINLIPGQDEKADLDAPAGSGGKLVTGQVPNISISSTTVVADATERLSLDVQEGDVAIQSNTSESFIFTGGPNLAPNWQVIQFDAVGGIQGEDIDPRDITARVIDSSLDITGVNMELSGTFNGANFSGAGAGELLGSDGSGNLQFTAPPSGGLSPIDNPSDLELIQSYRLEIDSNDNIETDSVSFDPNSSYFFQITNNFSFNETDFTDLKIRFNFTSGTKDFNFNGHQWRDTNIRMTTILTDLNSLTLLTTNDTIQAGYTLDGRFNEFP